MTNKNLFNQFPGKPEFFQTSDGSVFFNKSDAKNWAKELKDGVVNVITKSDSGKTKEAKTDVKSEDTPNKKELMAYYNSLTGKNLPKNIGLAKLQERIAEAEEMKGKMDIQITEQHLNDNPDLKEEGVQEGEVIQIPEAAENEDLTNENEENNETEN